MGNQLGKYNNLIFSWSSKFFLLIFKWIELSIYKIYFYLISLQLIFYEQTTTITKLFGFCI